MVFTLALPLCHFNVDLFVVTLSAVHRDFDCTLTGGMQDEVAEHKQSNMDLNKQIAEGSLSVALSVTS